LSITSLGGVFNYATVGPQSGTAPDVFAGNVQNLGVAWGQMASGPVAYRSYSSSFQFNVTVQSGQFAPGAQVLKLATILQGGTRGVTNASGLASSGTANTFLNATLQLDPGWASAHLGYALVMDPSIGVSPVPAPSAAAMMLVGLALLAGLRRGHG
jgi:MYXO-CTERM domain-containing protein